MISRVYYCFRLFRVSYSLYCNKLSVHNISPLLDWKFSLLLTLLVHNVVDFACSIRLCVSRTLFNPCQNVYLC